MSENLFFDKSKLKYLGKNVIIGKTVRIRNPERCIIGDNTIIDDFAYISAEIEIGKNCHIGSHVCISGGQGKFKMGDYSTLSSHVSVHCASSDYSETSLDLPSVPVEQRYGGFIEDVQVGDYVVVGSHSVILPGVIIPDRVACGAYTLMNKKQYEELGLYVGVPSKFLKKRIITKRRE